MSNSIHADPPPGFRLWNLYDPKSMNDLAVRLRQIVDEFAARDDPNLFVAVILGEFHRISHTSPPGVSQFAHTDESAA